jgi:hypothetical protein
VPAVIDTHSATVAVAYNYDPRYPDLSAVLPLPGVINLELSEDVDRTPFVMATVTAPRPDANTMIKLDPRTFPGLRIDMASAATVTHHLPALVSAVTAVFGPGAGFGSGRTTGLTNAYAGGNTASFSSEFPGTEVTSTLTPGVPATSRRNWLAVTDVDENIRDNTITIKASSNEVFLDYWANISPFPVDMAPYGDPLTIAMEVVRRVGLDGGFTSSGATPALPTADAMLWQPGQSAHDFIDGILEFNDLRIYCRSSGGQTWQIDPTGTSYDSGAGMINLDYRDGITTAGRGLSNGSGKNAYADAVLITYRWKNSAGVDQLAFDRYPNSGTYRKSLVFKRDRPFPGNGAAQGIYNRSRKRGGDFTARRVSRYDISTGWDSTLTLPGETSPRPTSIKSVSWSFPSAEMDIRLEEKEN